MTPKPTITVWSFMRFLQRLTRDRSRAACVSTSTVVLTRTIRKMNLRGVMTRMLVRRASSETGVMSP